MRQTAWAVAAAITLAVSRFAVVAIVARRTVTPFVDLADLSSVSGVAQARLVQIAGRARTLGFIGPSCLGVYEEHAVSTSDRDAMLTFVNGASEFTLRNAVPTNLDVAGAPLARDHGQLFASSRMHDPEHFGRKSRTEFFMQPCRIGSGGRPHIGIASFIDQPLDVDMGDRFLLQFAALGLGGEIIDQRAIDIAWVRIMAFDEI